MTDDLDKAVEAAKTLARSLDMWAKHGGNLISKEQATVVAADLRTILSALHQRGEALEECVAVMAMQEHPRCPDPAYHEEVKALGRRIGFGALMGTASAGWREVAAEKGYPTGGEFVAGPCFSTLTATLRKARQALSNTPGKRG